MRITCPQCGFFRELPDNKIPVTSTMATCPKCRHRFKFRLDPTVSSRSGSPGLEYASAGEEAPSSWRRQGQAAARHLSQTPPIPPVEPEDPPEEEPLAPPAAMDAAEPARAPEELPEEFSAKAPSPDEIPEEEAAVRPPKRTFAPASRFRSEPEAPPEIRQDTPAAPAPEEQPEDFEPETTPVAPRSGRRQHRDLAASPSDFPDSEASPTPPPPAAPAETPNAASPAEPPAASPENDEGTTLQADGVRDIWAKLQALDDEPPRKHTHESPPPEQEHNQERELITDPIPWERQDAYGFVPGLFLTLRKILFQPMEFFGSMPEGRPKGKALVFNLLISEFLLVIDFLWSLMGLRAKFGDPAQADILSVFSGSPSLSFLFALLLIPLVLSIGIYLDAWLTHLLLLLFRSSKKGFNETFRVLCYSAAPTVLSAVPVAGQILSPVILIWYMALQAIGLKKAHEGAYTQTLAAIFIKWSLYLFLLLAMLQSFVPAR